MDTTLLRALDTDGRDKFESAINALQGDVAAAAARLSVDPRLRLEYSKRIKEMASDTDKGKCRCNFMGKSGARSPDNPKSYYGYGEIAKHSPRTSDG